MPLLRALFDLLLRVPDRCQPFLSGAATLPGCPAPAAPPPPPGPLAAPASAASAPLLPTAAPACSHTPQLIALCLLAFPCIFVPSRLTRPSRSVPSSAAISSTCLNNPSNSPRNRFRKFAIVSWSGCSSPVMYRNATELIRRLLQLPARKHSRGIAVEQQCHHHDRIDTLAGRHYRRTGSLFHSDRVALLFPLQSVPICWSGSHSCMDGGRSIGVSRSSARKSSAMNTPSAVVYGSNYIPYQPP